MVFEKVSVGAKNCGRFHSDAGSPGLLATIEARDFGAPGHVWKGLVGWLCFTNTPVPGAPATSAEVTLMPARRVVRSYWR